MDPQVRVRLNLLFGRWAVPGWALLTFWLVGVWSDVEFGLDKIRVLSAYVSPWVFFAVGLGWLAWLVSRPPQAEARLAAMRRLLNEGAASCRSIRRREHETIKNVRPLVRMDLSLQQFLSMGFAHHVKRDYESFRNNEREKWDEAGQTFLVELVSADFLDGLAARLTAEDLDPGFHLPHSYAQFEAADTWTPNIRPLPNRKIEK